MSRSKSFVPPFVCPQCKGALDETSLAYRCRACSRDYPVILGIPDFRLAPDPWIGLADDRAKAERLAPLVSGRSFEDAVKTYWQITPTTPTPMAERYTAHVLGAEARSHEWLAWLDQHEPPAAPGCWLDVGCGTGDLLSAASARGVMVIGIDIALRWLVVARQRPSLSGPNTQLVCANGEHLPFAAESFSRVVSVGTIEHCEHAGQVVAEAHRVLTPGGVLRARTVNRYGLLPEPHVGVWGVGFVPRRWADRYVQWRSGQRYEHHRPLSRRELLSAFRVAGFSRVEVSAAAMLGADRARLTGAMRHAGPLYEGLRRIPVANSALGWVAPLLDARGTA